MGFNYLGAFHVPVLSHCHFLFLFSISVCFLTNHCRVVLFSSTSTAVSMGVIMSGTDPNPTIVGSHSRSVVPPRMATIMGDRDRNTTILLVLTIALIVAPGIITLARDCHNNVSSVCTTVLVSRDIMYDVVVDVVVVDVVVDDCCCCSCCCS